jgi:hypothetical protein
VFSLEIIVPVIMSCALLWYVSHGMSWNRRLVVAAIALVIVVCIVTLERGGFFQGLRRWIE